LSGWQSGDDIREPTGLRERRDLAGDVKDAH
jgi:hypothetical protein